MQSRANIFNDSQQQFGQREQFEGFRQGYGPPEPSKLVNLEQLDERRNFLLKLGLSSKCSHDLAMYTLEQPEFNLQQFQLRWNSLSKEFGPSRQVEVDTIILHEIRVHQQHQLGLSSRPRTPSPPRNWNSSGHNSLWTHAELDNRTPTAPNMQPQLGMTSTPFHNDRGSRVSREGADARNMKDWQFRNNINNNNYRNGGNQDRNANCNEDAYNIYADPRDFNDHRGEQMQHFTPQTSNGIRNYNDQNYNNNIFRNTESYQQRIAQNINAVPFNSENISAPQPQANNFGRVAEPLNAQRQFQQWLNFRRNKNYFQANFGRLNGSNEDSFFNNRKRVAEPLSTISPKKRNLGQPELFKIGDFSMPYIRNLTKPLPQPESDSYAISFFKRKHNKVINVGDAAITEVRDVLPFEKCSVSHNSVKRLRRELRKDWAEVHEKKDYSNWSTWWTDFKWCEAAIDEELKKYQGIFLKPGSILNIGFNEKSILFFANLALEVGSINYQTTIATLFELQDEKILAKISFSDKGRLQDLIRYTSNTSWVYKMRAMIYMWSRYSRIYTNDTPIESKHILVSQQWKSPQLHWLAKQAYEELKLISQIEYPEHTMIYPVEL